MWRDVREACWRYGTIFRRWLWRDIRVRKNLQTRGFSAFRFFRRVPPAPVVEVRVEGLSASAFGDGGCARV